MTGLHTDYNGDITFLVSLSILTVAQNIFIGRGADGFFCDDKIINQETESLRKDFNVDVNHTDRIGNLTVGKCQMVEITRAMSYPATKVLILDELTAALSEAEAKEAWTWLGKDFRKVNRCLRTD